MNSVSRSKIRYIAAVCSICCRPRLSDGSWLVKSRAPKFQPYFDTSFPYCDDQWISSAATAWAATALSYVRPASPPVLAAR